MAALKLSVAAVLRQSDHSLVPLAFVACTWSWYSVPGLSVVMVAAVEVAGVAQSFQLVVPSSRNWSEYPVMAGPWTSGAVQLTSRDVGPAAKTSGFSGWSGGPGIVMVWETGSESPSEFLRCAVTVYVVPGVPRTFSMPVMWCPK